MQTNKQLSTYPAAGQQPAKARWGFVARGGLALAIAMVLLAGLGFVVSEGAAAPPVDNRASAPRLGLTQPTSASWTDFRPTGWVNSVPFASSVTAADPAGLTPSTAAYHTSIDGGVSWTAWTQAGLNVTPVTSSTVTIAVTTLALPDSQSSNRIQFRIDTQQGATEASPAYTLLVDTVAPDSPLNMQSFPDTWTNVNAFRETWTNPADTSGIAGAYYRLDFRAAIRHRRHLRAQPQPHRRNPGAKRGRTQPVALADRPSWKRRPQDLPGRLAGLQIRRNAAHGRRHSAGAPGPERLVHRNRHGHICPRRPAERHPDMGLAAGRSTGEHGLIHGRRHRRTAHAGAFRRRSRRQPYAAGHQHPSHRQRTPHDFTHDLASTGGLRVVHSAYHGNLGPDRSGVRTRRDHLAA